MKADKLVGALAFLTAMAVTGPTPSKKKKTTNKRKQQKVARRVNRK